MVFISFPNMNGSWTLSDKIDNNLIDFYQYTVDFLLNEESVKKINRKQNFWKSYFIIKE